MGWVAYKLANIQVKRESIKQFGKSYKIKKNKNYIVVCTSGTQWAPAGHALITEPNYCSWTICHNSTSSFLFLPSFFLSFSLLSLVSTSRVISYILSLRRRVSCYITEAFSRRLFLSPQILILLSLSYTPYYMIIIKFQLLHF